MEGLIELSYSKDSGATWKTASTFGASSANLLANRVFPYIQPEPDGDSQTGLTNSELCYTGDARVYVLFEMGSAQFDQTTANGQKLLQFICALRCAPLIRLYYNGTDVNGFTLWATNNKTAYLVPHDCPPPEVPSSGETSVIVNFTLKAKSEYAI